MTLRLGPLRHVLRATCLTLLSACSFVGVNKVPADHAKLDEFDCTSGNAAPIVDTVIAAGGAAGVIGGIAMSGDSESGSAAALAMLAGAGVATVYGIAAIVGYRSP